LKHEGVFLLKGLLKCGLCGHAYIGETRVEERRDGGESLYHYYLCSMRMAPLPDAVRRRCPNDRLRVAGVNETVWLAVRDGAPADQSRRRPLQMLLLRFGPVARIRGIAAEHPTARVRRDPFAAGQSRDRGGREPRKLRDAR